MLRILISYANIQITEEEILGNYILSELNDFEFRSSIYNALLDEIKAQFEEFGKLDTNLLVRHENDEISTEVVNMLTDRFEISENWEKQDIFVAHESDDLGNVVYKSILRLKWRAIRVLLKENAENMKKAQNEVEMMDCVKINVKLKNTEMKIAKILGNVTI